MGRKTFAEVLTGTKLLVEGLKGRQSVELPAGVAAQQITEIEQLHKKVEGLNTQQEKLKADLKVKTAELDAAVKEMEEKVAVVRKYVKLGTKQEEWREFGIEDKR